MTANGSAVNQNKPKTFMDAFISLHMYTSHFHQQLFESSTIPLTSPLHMVLATVSLPFHAFHPGPSVAGTPCTPHPASLHRPAHKGCLCDSLHCTTAPNSPASLGLCSTLHSSVSCSSTLYVTLEARVSILAESSRSANLQQIPASHNVLSV